MLQTEFEERYGKTVTTEAYSLIERQYMACPTIDKDRFCKEYKEKKLGDSFVVADLTDRVTRLDIEKQQWQHTAEQEQEVARQYKRDHEAAIETNRQLAEERDKLKEMVEELAFALIRASREEEAIGTIGRDAVISLKCANNIYLDADDKAYIADRLKF